MDVVDDKNKDAARAYSEDVKHEYHEGPHHQPALERNFSFWSCLGLAFAILNSWNGTWTGVASGSHRLCLLHS